MLLMLFFKHKCKLTEVQTPQNQYQNGTRSTKTTTKIIVLNLISYFHNFLHKGFFPRNTMPFLKY